VIFGHMFCDVFGACVFPGRVHASLASLTVTMDGCASSPCAVRNHD